MYVKAPKSTENDIICHTCQLTTYYYYLNIKEKPYVRSLIMLYPMKFVPVYKDYIWGGRYFEKLGRQLPDGKVAESWEVSCHKNGVNIVANGELKGKTLLDVIAMDSKSILGTRFNSDCKEVPLLIKLIDANDRLSVQVHPDDSYAAVFEGGLGKNEMWYIVDAKPGAKLVAGLKPGVTKEAFELATKENRIEECLNEIEVKRGDVIFIPAGLIHSIGEGIVIVEIQQISDTTYRVFDYNRVYGNGVERPLQIDKALDVIDFKPSNRSEKYKGITVKHSCALTKTYMLANRYFSCERYDANGEFSEATDGSKFYIYIFLEGSGSIKSGEISLTFNAGETIFIPAALGEYTFDGCFTALKTYVPDLINDIVEKMRAAGCSDVDIFSVLK